MDHIGQIVPLDVVKLVAAFLLGALLGAEREYHDKSAGMRTIILICVGACLFTIFSVYIAGNGDPGRIAAQIVTGVGFIGAGVILQRRGQVRGLTTASTIWIAAALGIGVGIGYVFFTAIATVLAVAVLWILPSFERVLERARMYRLYKVTTVLDESKASSLVRMFKDHDLTVLEESRGKQDGKLVAIWSVGGRPEAHARVISAMLADPEIYEIDF